MYSASIDKNTQNCLIIQRGYNYFVKKIIFENGYLFDVTFPEHQTSYLCVVNCSDEDLEKYRKTIRIVYKIKRLIIIGEKNSE